MSLLDAAQDLKTGSCVIYQDRTDQYQFRSAVVTSLSLTTSPPYVSLTSTDVRSRDEDPILQLQGDHVFYRVPVGLLEGMVSVEDAQKLVAEQNVKLLGPELSFLAEMGMYETQIADQLEEIVGSYIPADQMPRFQSK